MRRALSLSHDLLDECSSRIIDRKVTNPTQELILKREDSYLFRLTYEQNNCGDEPILPITNETTETIYVKVIPILEYPEDIAQPSLDMRQRIYNVLKDQDIACIIGEPFEFEDLYVIITEGADSDLDKFLTDSHLNFNQKIKLCIDVCLLVQKMHKLGIAHGDLKPKNILVFIKDGTIRVQLTDFEGSLHCDDFSSHNYVFHKTLNYCDDRLLVSEVSKFDDLLKADRFSLLVVIMDIIINNKPRISLSVKEKIEKIHKEHALLKPIIDSLYEDSYLDMDTLIESLKDLKTRECSANYLTKPLPMVIHDSNLGFLFGYIYKYNEIWEYVQMNGKCPKTDQECTMNDIVPLERHLVYKKH